MATPKKTTTKKTTTAKAKSVKAAVPPPTPPPKTTKKVATALTGEQLVVENLFSLSTLVRSLSETLDTLVQKAENMAYHIIATEEIVTELVGKNGIDLAKVNERIRKKIAKGTAQQGDASRAIDIAATIVSSTIKQ